MSIEALVFSVIFLFIFASFGTDASAKTHNGVPTITALLSVGAAVYLFLIGVGVV